MSAAMAITTNTREPGSDMQVWEDLYGIDFGFVHHSIQDPQEILRTILNEPAIQPEIKPQVAGAASVLAYCALHHPRTSMGILTADTQSFGPNCLHGHPAIWHGMVEALYAYTLASREEPERFYRFALLCNASGVPLLTPTITTNLPWFKLNNH